MSEWVQGRGWEVYRNGNFHLHAFDAFGNRDHYDYSGYFKDECIYRGKRQPEDVAIKRFKEVAHEVRVEANRAK